MPRIFDNSPTIVEGSESAVIKMKRKTMQRWVIGLIVIVSGVVALVYYFFWSRPANIDDTQILRVGYQNSPAMALIMIAEKQGYFAKPKVTIELKEFTAGKFALQAFFGGSLDVAVAGDVPSGLALLQGLKFSVIGEVLKDSMDAIRMVVRNQGGCTVKPEKYFEEHRRISTSFGGGPEYFTYNFFRSHHISQCEKSNPNQFCYGDVEIINQKPEDMPGALAAKSVDGISIFDPQAGSAESELGPHQSCTFDDPGTYREHYVIVTTPTLGEKADPRVQVFVNGLREAEMFSKNNSDKAMKIVADKTRLGLGQVEQMWGNYDFGVTLDNGLKTLWKDEADWYKKKPGVPGKFASPDYDQILVETYLSK